MYSAEDFGLLAIFIAIVTVLTSAATFRIDWLVSTTRVRHRAGAVLVFGLASTFLVVFLTCVALALDAHLLVGGIDWEALGSLSALVPVGVLGASLFALASAWFVRQAWLAPVAKSKVAQSAWSSVIILLWGAIAPSAVGLAVSSIVNAAAGSVNLVRAARRRATFKLRALKANYVISVIGKHRGRLLFSGLTGLTNTVGLYAPVLIIGYYFLPSELGWFSVMMKVGLAPTAAISAAVSQSLWGEMSLASSRQTNDLDRLFRQTSLNLKRGGVAAFLFCLAGPLYAAPIFGPSWHSAGWVLAALSPMVGMHFLASTLAPVVTALGAVRWLLWWDCGRTALIVATLVSCSRLGGSLLVVVATFSVVMSAMYLVLYRKAAALALSRPSAAKEMSNDT